MGYRSDVVIAISHKGKLQSILFDTDIKIIKEADNIIRDEEADYYFFEGWKWYEDYPDIKALMDFLTSLDDEDYGFVRIGEENSDIEELGSPYDYNIGVSSYIYTPFD